MSLRQYILAHPKSKFQDVRSAVLSWKPEDPLNNGCYARQIKFENNASRAKAEKHVNLARQEKKELLPRANELSDIYQRTVAQAELDMADQQSYKRDMEKEIRALKREVSRLKSDRRDSRNDAAKTNAFPLRPQQRKRCFTWGKPGHFAAQCSQKGRRSSFHQMGNVRPQ